MKIENNRFRWFRHIYEIGGCALQFFGNIVVAFKNSRRVGSYNSDWKEGEIDDSFLEN
jgi:hypothetical protein